jgi:catechol 2,3-dioxygenase-like lactoylglutathione lyase family enzyme
MGFIKQINPIILFVKNFESCYDFYKNKLDLEIVKGDSSHENFVEFKIGDISFDIHGGYKGEPVKNNNIGVHFVVEDIFTTFQILKNNNVEITKEPQKMPWGDYELTIKDPDGNLIDILQMTSKDD